MNQVLVDHSNPLRADVGGAIRVGNTRVTLESVVFMFEEGATPEMIVEEFPSLELSEVYLTLGFYLRNSQQVEEYLQTKRVQAEHHRSVFESRLSPTVLKKRLYQVEGNGK